MKKCKIHSTAQNKESDGVIIDNLVLIAAPQKDGIKPTKVLDGVCYYPPCYALEFAHDMYCVPFSVECEWGEHGECWKEYSGKYVYSSDIDDNDPRPIWAIYYGIDDIPEKWGYCQASTGEIREVPLQFSHIKKQRQMHQLKNSWCTV